MAIPIIGAVIASAWLKTAIVDAIKWVALRTLLITICSTLIPIAIYQGWLLIQEQIMSYVTAQTASGVWDGTMVELTGFAGWIGDRLLLIQCFQVLAGFLTLKFMLRIVARY